MSQFERDLRESLRRREPPPGFAGRVLARTREIDERSEGRSAWKWSWRWVTVAAAVVMLVVGISLYQEHQRQVQAERSKEQLMLALRITGSKLHAMQEKLSQIQRKTIELPIQQ
jgi:multidrug efflux pump subunit AcrB